MWYLWSESLERMVVFKSMQSLSTCGLFVQDWQSLLNSVIYEQVVFMDMWYLQTCGLYQHVVLISMWSLWNGGLQEQVVFMNRWYLCKGLYEHVVFV